MRVLFVCTGNSFRSPLAEALARKYVPEMEVESAGTHPAAGIAGNAKRFLEEDGARKFVKPGPERITQRAIEDADRIVAMKQEHRDFIIKHFDAHDSDIRVWDIDDPINPGVDDRKAFRAIRARVKELENEV